MFQFARLAVCLLLLYACAGGIQASPTLAAANAVTFRAIGLGVTSRERATAWYGKVFGLKTLTTMKLSRSRTTPWDEDINYFSGGKGSSIVIMEWKERPSRNVRNLPIKLQFSFRDPERVKSLIISNGGSAANVSVARSGVVYAKDPDGYLLELIPGTSDTYLASVGIGVGNVNQVADWWSKTTGLTVGTSQRGRDWTEIGLRGSQGSELAFMEWHESPRRPTSNLPIKVVMMAPSTNNYLNSLRQAGGKVKTNLAVVAFAEDPHEKTLIEVNQGSGGR